MVAVAVWIAEAVNGTGRGTRPHSRGAAAAARRASGTAPAGLPPPSSATTPRKGT